MTKQYMLDISFPLDDKWIATQEAVEDVLGISPDSGTDFARRELSYIYNNVEARTKAILELNSASLANVTHDAWDFDPSDCE